MVRTGWRAPASGGQPEQAMKLRVNGKLHEIDAADDEPLLYVLANDLGLTGPRFGCGLAQCGSCSVLVDDVERRACVTPAGSVAGRAITTLEGLPQWHALRMGRRATRGRELPLHPVQQALIDVAAPQCGYCMNGMAIKAAELLASTPDPTDAQIRAALNGHLCRCGTYPRILAAIRRAALAMRTDSRA
jgi:aerobic-type carbon monoxide dehydrogenase small subunit (CoxS/CutS family)